MSFEAEELIALLVRRLEAKDCRQNGWILENFPQTKEQAVLMAQKGIMPKNVFSLQIDADVCYKRSAAVTTPTFDDIGDILKQRISFGILNQPQVSYFF